MKEASVPANLVHYSHKGQWWHFRASTSIHFHGNKTIPESDFVQSKWLCVITRCTSEETCHRSPNNVTILYLNKFSIHLKIFYKLRLYYHFFQNLATFFHGKRSNINAIIANKWKEMQRK